MSLPEAHTETNSSLPISVAEMADVLGLPFVVKLVERFGGVELRIPHKLHEKHQLMALGGDDATKLCAYCPGDTILVPISLMTGRRKGMVAKLQEKGFNRSQIARQIGISQRHVRRLANPHKDPNQGNLL